MTRSTINLASSPARVGKASSKAITKLHAKVELVSDEGIIELQAKLELSSNEVVS